VPGVGFALGVDRMLLACDAEDVFGPPRAPVEVFVVCTTGGLDAVVLCDELRSAGIGADRAYDNRSMKSQMKAADRSGAALAVIVGQDEAAAGSAAVRSLRGEGTQSVVSRARLVDHIRGLLG